MTRVNHWNRSLNDYEIWTLKWMESLKLSLLQKNVVREKERGQWHGLFGLSLIKL